jgi:hypothetical protein
VDVTARVLGVSRADLERRLGAASAAGAVTVAAAGPAVAPRAGGDAIGRGFVEIDTRVLGGSQRVIVQLEGRDGERLRVELGDAAALDVVALARAFLGRAQMRLLVAVEPVAEKPHRGFPVAAASRRTLCDGQVIGL